MGEFSFVPCEKCEANYNSAKKLLKQFSEIISRQEKIINGMKNNTKEYMKKQLKIEQDDIERSKKYVENLKRKER